MNKQNNAINVVLAKMIENHACPAIWLPDEGTISFGKLAQMAGAVQKTFLKLGLKAGDPVLMLAPLSSKLYAAILGLSALGAQILFVEPWMQVERINHILALLPPKYIYASRLGLLWGWRSKAVRAIPHRILLQSIDWKDSLAKNNAINAIEVVAVKKTDPAMITFTSGTTGNPKGIVRTHGYLKAQQLVLTKSLYAFHDVEQTKDQLTNTPDMCIFGNFALNNLARGVLSVIVPSGWKTAHLRAVAKLPYHLAPTSLTCGPAFLLRLLKEEFEFKRLTSLHIGGALSDISLLEMAFKKWPQATFTHVYGSTEAEPVAVCDARKAVALSKQRGFFQTLYLGQPVPEIKAKLAKDSLWIAGDHVCTQYVADHQETSHHKNKDDAGLIWHRMGDRITEDEDGWWYGGREAQLPEDFLEEQSLYKAIHSSAAFIARERHEEVNLKVVYCKRAKERQDLIQKNVAVVDRIYESKIVRDKRHKARIDRIASCRKRCLVKKVDNI